MINKNLPFKSLLLFFALLGSSLISFGQGRTVRGTVTDSNGGSPIPGVTVQVKEVPSVGTVTDANGHFSLTLPSNGDHLIFSFVGYDNQTLAASQGNMQVHLTSGKNLNEVVVVGYGTQKARDVSGAVSTLSAKNFNQGVVTNPMQQIQGKVSGLLITQPGGDPNQNVIIRLRGQTSLTGGQTPLIVVDGVPLDNPSEISNIPPGDIASYDVLKDASATAIYGSRGANGVIIINTKKGKAGQTQVSYSGYVGMDKIAKKYDLLNAPEWLAGVTQLGINPAVIQGYQKGGNTDWTNAITRTAYTQSHEVAISGGTNEFTYRASASYLDQQGIVINSGKEEYGVRFNAEQRAINDKLDIIVGIVNTQTNRKYTDYSNFNYVFSTPPTYPVYNPDGSFFAYNDFEQANPVEHLTQELNTGKEYLTLTNATVNYELTQGLILGTTGSLSRYSRHTDYFQPAFPLESTINYAHQFAENRDSKHGDIHVNFARQFGGKHNFTATAVYEYNDYKYNNFYAGGQQFLVEANQDNSLGLGNSQYNSINSYQDEFTLISFLGRVTYNYMQKYYLEGSFRRDGSSKFGANNRWGNFPSISGAWRVSGENFMKDVTWVNDLKLRAGYGVTGNQDAISPYNTQLLLGGVGNYYDAGNSSFPYPTAYKPSQNANPDLKWEERVGVNLGLNFSLFQNRLSGDFNVFHDQTNDLLYNYTVPVPPFYVNTILANVGTLTNKGVELELNGEIVKGPHFTWNAGGQITFVNTKVTSLSGTYAGYKVSTDNIPGGVAEGRGLSSNPITFLKVGYSPYVFYLPHFVGLDANGNQLFDSLGSKVQAGHGINRYIDPAPKFSYGFNSTFTYDNWSLNFFLRGVYGQKIFNNTLLDIQTINRLPGNNVTKEALTNGIKDAPIASDLWLENASFLRLDNMTLAYTFSHIKGIQNLQVFVTGNNLFVITPYKGLDPEIRTGDTNQAYIDANYGGDGYYPRTRSYSIGVHVSFK
ncbi:MAG: SusC/RagA family TonB-linked outer membrane protein [Chitinophagaceae bacterium]